MSCEKHPTEISGYTLQELAEKIGDFRYDCLGDFLEALANKIRNDADKDASRKRPKLAEQLFALSNHLYWALEHSDEAWEISKPFMSVDDASS